MAHRGPDGQGVSTIDLPWCNVTLGMNRLKIVDQKKLNVPFSFPQLGVHLAYNGEVYNWRSIRADIGCSGHAWQTECDAEIVAAAWRQWGPNCLHRFNGMFAFVLVDYFQKQIFIVRDRAGEKPLYYARRKERLYIASEIKALPVEWQEAECPEMVALEFDCNQNTPWKDVQVLEPGHYILLNGTTGTETVQPRRWWSLPWREEDHGDIEFQEAVEEVEKLVVDAVRIRILTEVPYAVQLSGGLDSAIVQAVAKSERLYCVTFRDEGIDNLAMAKEAAGPGLAREVVPVEFTYEDLISTLNDIAYHLDTPATWTACCQWFLAKAIAADGNKICISGEGADELAGGYSRYRILFWLDKMFSDAHLSAYKPLISRILGTKEDILINMLNRSGLDGIRPARSLVARATADYKGESAALTSLMGRVDFYTTMQVLLRMPDRMCMAWGIENRSPFLDYRLMERLATLPVSMKISIKESKSVLREVARRLGVSSKITEETTKKGLFIPPAWIKRISREQGINDSALWDRKGFTQAMHKCWCQAFADKENCNRCYNNT